MTKNHYINTLLLVVFGFAVFQPNVKAQLLVVSGQKMINTTNNQEVVLNAINFGNWMVMEGYMMNSNNQAPTQHEWKQKLTTLMGSANVTTFYNAWLGNHVTLADIKQVKAWGFNAVRIPLHYEYFVNLGTPDVWNNQGFVILDSIVDWCSATGVYAVVDLHAAPGGQSNNAISDYDNTKPSLWESEANQSKTVRLWRKLSERYKNESWIAGYDLINEPAWDLPGGTALRNLYGRLTDTIRANGDNHALFIEGNWYSNDYAGLTPAWDANMVYVFHKYWSNTTDADIKWVLDLRTAQNRPIWCGEHGENSNTNFTKMAEMLNKNNIGMSWWPMKKFESINDFADAKWPAGYMDILNYLGGTNPGLNPATALTTLMQLAENVKLANTKLQAEVVRSVFTQPGNRDTQPFATNKIPGLIYAANYDMGMNEYAYYDEAAEDVHLSTGTYTAWNEGWTFRNNGVDIEACTDPLSNGYNVGWTGDSEWMQYTANVDSTAAYNVNFRYAALNGGSEFKLLVNNSDITGARFLASTGGYKSWVTYSMNDVILYKGQQKIKIFFDKAGANFNSFSFNLSKRIGDVLFEPVSAETFKETELIYVSLNKQLAESTVSGSAFSCMVNNKPVSITSLTINPDNHYQAVISIGQKITDIDNITISYSNGNVKATDGTSLQNIINLPVKNNMPVNTLVPGKIEAEAFVVNQGLVLENCTDVGGGKDLGYTSTNDYLEYRVRVMKTSKYLFEARIACLNASGLIEVQQLGSDGAVVNSAQLAIPVTGGWQTWQTVATTVNLTEGTCTIRVKILQPEFNMNWFQFTESSAGIYENATTVFSIYPNPANNEVSILIPGSNGKMKTIRLHSSSGILMRRTIASASEESKKLSVADLPRGLYIVEVEMDGRFYRNKLILQ